MTSSENFSSFSFACLCFVCMPDDCSAMFVALIAMLCRVYNHRWLSFYCHAWITQYGLVPPRETLSYTHVEYTKCHQKVFSAFWAGSWQWPHNLTPWTHSFNCRLLCRMQTHYPAVTTHVKLFAIVLEFKTLSVGHDGKFTHSQMIDVNYGELFRVGKLRPRIIQATWMI